MTCRSAWGRTRRAAAAAAAPAWCCRQSSAEPTRSTDASWAQRCVGEGHVHPSAYGNSTGTRRLPGAHLRWQIEPALAGSVGLLLLAPAARLLRPGRLLGVAGPQHHLHHGGMAGRAEGLRHSVGPNAARCGGRPLTCLASPAGLSAGTCTCSTSRLLGLAAGGRISGFQCSASPGASCAGCC